LLYSEIFKSCQAEGYYTGVPSIWLRLFNCNFRCDGFGQDDPTDKSSYDLPWQRIDAADVTSMDQMPVFSKGCDSSYSWAKKFKHLQHDMTAEEVVVEMDKYLPENGVWVKDNGYEFDMVFTGGEPLLKPNQKNIIELLKVWKDKPKGQRPERFTFETNGTQKITDDLFDAFAEYGPSEVLMSYSPKLFTVSGEENKRAIRSDVIAHNQKFVERFGFATYKFVLTPDDRAWDELEWAIDELCVDRRDVWIMPVGGTVEGQEVHDGILADRAINMGYKVSARLHVYIFGNCLGK